jgi:hypothetical protein
MVESPIGSYLFYLGRPSYGRTRLLALLLLGVYTACALLFAWIGIRLFGTYSHSFTPYLKWQDLMEILCWLLAAASLGGCVLVVHFLYALHAGYHKGMIRVVGSNELTVRDLSPKNLASIFWMVGTAMSCSVAAVVGLVPMMLIGWTIHLPNPLLVVLGTLLALALGAAGLVLTAISGSFVAIGWAGGISFCRNLGAPHTYELSDQTTLRIDDFVLTVIYPDRPESLIDLNQLHPEDQRHLLFLLRERWLDAHRPWNPQLGEQIEAALEEAEVYTMAG